MVSSLEIGIVTTPTLFGLDPGELVNGASVADMTSMRDAKPAAEAGVLGGERTLQQPAADDDGRPHTLTFTKYDSVFDLIADTSGEKHIRALSQHAWVQVGPDKYVLSSPGGSYLRIEGTTEEEHGGSTCGEPLFRAVEVRALPAGVSKSPYAAPRQLLSAATFADAVHGADKFASEAYPRVFIHRYQRWRGEPPTDGQLQFLNRLRGGGQEPLTAKDMTKGQAVDMITKIKHGARGRFADVEARRRRHDRQIVLLEQEAARKRREKVSVGPLEP
jgi:ATP-dependent helicase IRC3